MESKRLQKIERLIQKELGDIFLLETKKMPGIMISVTRVRMSPDLGLAKAYLSVFPSEKASEMMDNINTHKKAIRWDLGERIGKQVRRIPELAFFVDDSLDYLDNIDKLLNNDKES